MSSHRTKTPETNLTRRTLVIGFAVVSLGAGVAGCGVNGFQPLYGTTAGGVRVNDEMAAIHIVTIPGRVGQRIRNQLLFKTGASDSPVTPRYRLEIAIRESVQSILVEIDGDASGQVYNLQAGFKLIDASSNRVEFTGNSESQAAFQRFTSIFANTRARRDAEDRAAREVARTIQTRVAAYLSRTA